MQDPPPSGTSGFRQPPGSFRQAHWNQSVTHAICPQPRRPPHTQPPSPSEVQPKLPAFVTASLTVMTADRFPSHSVAMTTAPKDSQQFPAVSRRMNKLGASSMVISLLTGPLLVTLMGARAVADALTQAGIASEEFFRGERLPNLPNVPSPADEQIDQTDRE